MVAASKSAIKQLLSCKASIHSHVMFANPDPSLDFLFTTQSDLKCVGNAFWSSRSELKTGTVGQPPGVVSCVTAACKQSCTLSISWWEPVSDLTWPHLTSPDLTMTSCSGQQVSPDQDPGWLLLLRVGAAGALPRPRPQRRGDGPRHDRRHRQRGRGHGRRPQHAGD